MQSESSGDGQRDVLPYFGQTPGQRGRVAMMLAATGRLATRMGRWFAGLPPWLIGLALVTGATVVSFWDLHGLLPLGVAGRRIMGEACLYLPALVLFVPGALHRRNWRHVLIMVALGIGWLAANAYSYLSVRVVYPYYLALYPGVGVLVAGGGEWALTRRGDWRAAVGVVLAAVTTASAAALMCEPLAFTDVSVGIPNGRGGSTCVGWDMVRPPVLVCLAWLTIPAALRPVSGEPYRWGRWIGLVSGTAVAFALCFGWLVYLVAERSLINGSPFGRNTSAEILMMRGSSADRELLWKALAEADWRPESKGMQQDYRRTALWLLKAADRPQTAQRAADLLYRKPTGVLAAIAAPLLAEERRYEMVPVLMRYALLQRWECTDALERMGVPEAGMAILLQEVAFRKQYSLNPQAPLEPEMRRRLAALLGEDAGEELEDWLPRYDALIAGRPTPLLPEQKAELKRVIDVLAIYWDALYRLHKAKMQARDERMREKGLRFPGQNVLDQCWEQVSKEMDVAPPDWDAAGTAGLEREVREYAQRVDAMVAEHMHEASTKPTRGD